jgi:glycine/D-amino acid oxidase-like deaminating enzyme
MSHIVVVGAGVFGAWSARQLAAAGHRVTLIDAHGPANSRSSSSDETRIVRCGYGPDEIYTQFALRSLELWREFAAAAPAGPPVFHPCGVLWLTSADDPYTQATRRTLERQPYPCKVLDRAGLRTRYPHLLARDVGEALLEIEGGVVMARRSVQMVVADLVAGGVRYVRARAAVPWAPGPLRAVRLTGGGDVEADAFVFACGAWLPTVFPKLLQGLIQPTRQVVVYFGTPAGDDRFCAPQTPAWVDFAGGVYGVPDIEYRGLKVGLDQHGPAFDPDTGERLADAESIERARQWLSRRFPALAGAPIVETRVCQYENTSSGDFLIDRHPDHPNVLIVGGGSGHGFKHGPAIGEYVARLLATGAPAHERFRLAAKTTAAARAVY